MCPRQIWVDFGYYYSRRVYYSLQQFSFLLQFVWRWPRFSVIRTPYKAARNWQSLPEIPECGLSLQNVRFCVQNILQSMLWNSRVGYILWLSTTIEKGCHPNDEAEETAVAWNCKTISTQLPADVHGRFLAVNRMPQLATTPPPTRPPPHEPHSPLPWGGTSARAWRWDSTRHDHRHTGLLVKPLSHLDVLASLCRRMKNLVNMLAHIEYVMGKFCIF